jgi:putative hemolysin
MHARTGIILILLLCLAAGIFIAGCTQQATNQTTPAQTIPAQATHQVPAGLANPASVSCIDNGGTLAIKNNADGSQYGMCTFQNGTSCEEWALFRNEGCKPAGAPAPQ